MILFHDMIFVRCMQLKILYLFILNKVYCHRCPCIFNTKSNSLLFVDVPLSTVWVWPPDVHNYTHLLSSDPHPEIYHIAGIFIAAATHTP